MGDSKVMQHGRDDGVHVDKGNVNPASPSLPAYIINQRENGFLQIYHQINNIFQENDNNMEELLYI
jgi:hypothetical protein